MGFDFILLTRHAPDPYDKIMASYIIYWTSQDLSDNALWDSDLGFVMAIQDNAYFGPISIVSLHFPLSCRHKQEFEDEQKVSQLLIMRMSKYSSFVNVTLQMN